MFSVFYANLLLFRIISCFICTFLQAFCKPDKYGVCAGADYGFTSTTLEQSVALSYSQDTEATASTMVAIQASLPNSLYSDRTALTISSEVLARFTVSRQFWDGID